MMMMFEEDDQECLQIYDRVLDYLERVRHCDDIETQNIQGRAFGYLIKCAFDDMGNALNGAHQGFRELTNKITETIKENYT